MKTVVGHFKGLCYVWDVVNKALNDDETLRTSNFLEVLGEAYISLSFQFTREADPVAKLCSHDFNLEVIPSKAAAAKDLVHAV
jgi:Beta-1,4-xylanase